MNGWLYLIKNGDLYKIGITKNLKNRMRKLKPDCVIAKLYSNKFKQLERELHKRYKTVRIPQTEYFRLERWQVNEIIKIINKYYSTKTLIFKIFKEVSCLLLILFLVVSLSLSLVISDINYMLFVSVLVMEKISFILVIISILTKSNLCKNIINDFQYRFFELIVFIFYGLFFRYASSFYFQ